jgi:chemotaxis protein histidine kinase CheA
VPLVLVESDGRRLALAVNGIGDRADVVVRSVGSQLRGIACIAGATILGDGQVVLIIDLPEISRASALSEASPELLLSPS